MATRGASSPGAQIPRQIEDLSETLEKILIAEPDSLADRLPVGAVPRESRSRRALECPRPRSPQAFEMTACRS